MVNNTVDPTKFEGAGRDNTLFVSTSLETSGEKNRIERYAGKLEFGILAGFGQDMGQYVTCKYEKNTRRDISTRETARKKSEGLTH